MKNVRMLLVGLIAGALLATSATAFAGPALERIAATLRPDYKVKVDGTDVTLKNAPLSYNGTTYVPLREAGEIFGYKVGFKAGTITLDQIEKDVEPVSGTNVVDPQNVGDWVAFDELEKIGVSVTKSEDQKMFILSSGEKTLTFPVLARDVITINKDNHSIRRKDGEYYVSKSAYNFFQ